MKLRNWLRSALQSDPQASPARECLWRLGHFAQAPARWLLWLGFAIALAVPAAAQSNSLFKSGRVQSHPAPTTQPATGGGAVAPAPNAIPSPVRIIHNEPDSPPPPNLALLQSSLIAVQVPKPRRFKVNDLVTVIVREDKRSRSDAKIESEKKWEVDSELQNWIRIHDHHLVPQTFPNGTPGVIFDWNDKYDGE